MSLKNDYFYLVFLLILMMIPNFSTAIGISEGAGTAGYDFLKLDPGAKATAMGGAYVGLANSLEGYLSNPGAIGFKSKKAKVFGSYGNMYAGINKGLLGYSQELAGYQTGFSLDYINYGTLTRTDEEGDVRGDFSASSFNLVATFGKKLKGNISWGLSPQIVYQAIDSLASWGVCIDAGLFAQFHHGRTGVGLVLKNFGFQKEGFERQHKDYLPISLTLGAARELRGLPLTISVDLVSSIDNYYFVKAGGELDVLEPLFLRVGWQLRPKVETITNSAEDFKGFTGGFGVKLEDLYIDYSISSYGVLGTIQRFTFGYKGF